MRDTSQLIYYQRLAMDQMASEEKLFMPPLSQVVSPVVLVWAPLSTEIYCTASV